MKRTLIQPNRDHFPEIFHPLLDGPVFDSSCSPTARVWFLEQHGCYLKKAPKGSLRKEAEMTRFFHGKGLAAEVLAYESQDSDWLLTARIPGEDCTFPMYRQDPVRLCDTTAELLRMLHNTDAAGCPIPNRTADYLATAHRNHRAGIYDMQFFPESADPEDAWKLAEAYGPLLKNDTLLHGDYCLPNIMLDNWRFSGFIDLDTGGVGDRHVDLFWGIWSLNFNLKTNQYRDRFLDAYGRENIQEDLIRIVGAIEVFG